MNDLEPIYPVWASRRPPHPFPLHPGISFPPLRSILPLPALQPPPPDILPAPAFASRQKRPPSTGIPFAATEQSTPKTVRPSPTTEITAFLPFAPWRCCAIPTTRCVEPPSLSSMSLA
jgi:hypothetical protein